MFILNVHRILIISCINELHLVSNFLQDEVVYTHYQQMVLLILKSTASKHYTRMLCIPDSSNGKFKLI